MNTKTVQVVMVPTKLSTNYGDILKLLVNIDGTDGKKGDIIFNPFNSQCKDDVDTWQTQHLYFLSNEPIKEGDLCYDPDADTGITKCLRTDPNGYWNKHSKKIIASTNIELGLPAIPEEWIRDVYVPSNGSIKEVLLRTTKGGLWFNPDVLHNEVVIVNEPNILEMTLKAITLSDDFIDQELEDAANSHSEDWVYTEYGNDVRENLSARKEGFKAGFKAGAAWQKEQSANDAIEFLNQQKEGI